MAEKIKLGPDATWGNYGKDLLMNLEHRIHVSIEGPYCSDDEGCNYAFSYRVNKGVVDGQPQFEELRSSAEVVIINTTETRDENGNVVVEETEGGAYDGTLNQIVDVKVTANEGLVSRFPLARVYVDGAEYDLGVLNKPIRFVTNKTHRICIHWLPGTVEIFRVRPQVLK